MKMKGERGIHVRCSWGPHPVSRELGRPGSLAPPMSVRAPTHVKLHLFGHRPEMRAGIKVFNVTNHFNPRDVQQNILSPDFGAFFNGVGRKFRAKLEFNF